MDKPTEEERLGFVESYGVEPVTDINTDLTFKDAAKTVAEFTPIIGDAIAAKEVYDELMKDEPNYGLIAALGGAALVGAVPGIGDAAAAGIRKAVDVAKRVEVDPDAVGMMGGNIRIKPKTAANQPNIISFTEKRKEITEAKELQDTYDALNTDVKGIAKRKQKLVKEAEQVGIFGEYEVGATVQGRNKKGPLPFKIEGHSLDEVKLDSPSFKRLQDKADGNLTIIEKDGKYYIPKLITSNEKGQKGSSYLDLVKSNNYPIMGKLEVVDTPTDVWSYPKQLYDSADTSINVSKKPAGYNELKKRGEIKDGDVIVDIGGGRFDNLVEDAAEEGATVKVYDPFNRTPEHNAAVVDSVKDGQADMAMSHNVLNVIQEDKNIIDIAVQAENAIKPNGKAHFSVYEGTGKGEGKVTTKGYQRNEKTQAYVPLIEQVFGKGNVTRKGKIITATKNVKEFNEGGMAMEEQMAMNFGDVPDNTIGIDPVSGNEIPMGSTAENVRDDIPANLSEGEIVVPADVVNFHGVKLFEDLRAEAKMGYAQMAEDGRMGGEPMEDDMEMENDIGLDLADLETMEVPDDAEPVEMRRGGMNFERGRGNIYKSYSAPKPTPRVVRSAPPSFKTRSVGSLKDSSPSVTVTPPKQPSYTASSPTNTYTPSQLGITVPTTSGPKRPNLQSQPPTGDNVYPSIGDQINFGGKGLELRQQNTVEPKSTAERLADIRQRNQERYQGAGYVDKARDAAKFVGGLFGFGDEQEKEGPQRFQIGSDLDLGFSGSPLERANRKGFGPKRKKFDEGGMATDDNLIGGEDQFNQPFYAPDQKGGFDMDMAYPDQVSGGTGEPVLEMREYMNDQGHRMFITFIDGEPQMEIPAGYYPVGETTTMQPVGITGTTTANYGTSSQNDDPGVEDMVMPEGINYKELSLAELQEMVEDQKSFGSKIFGNLSPVTKIIMWDQTRRIKAELERRRDDPYTSEVDKRRYDTLLELANRDEPGLVSTLLNKITGKEPDVPQARTPEQTSALYSQLDKMTKAYTPDVQTANDRTTPGVDTDRGFTPGVDDAISIAKPAATAAIPEQSTDADAFDKMQDRFDIERIEAEMKAQERPVKTPTTPIRQTSPRVQQARQNTQKVMQDMRDRGASREERTQSLKAAARTENVLRDLDRGVVRGFEKGGLASKKKGRKKKSK